MVSPSSVWARKQRRSTPVPRARATHRSPVANGTATAVATASTAVGTAHRRRAAGQTPTSSTSSALNGTSTTTACTRRT